MILRPARAAAALLLALGGAAPADDPPAPQAAHPAAKRLESLLGAAEKALAEGRRGEASAGLEQAATLVAGWSAEDLRNPVVQGLLERLRNMELSLQGSTAEPGLKVEEEVVTLSGEDLRAQMARVQEAEAGTSYDFPIDLNDKVLTWVREFTTTRRPFIEKALGRGARYLPMVRQIFAEEGVPQDLVYLAVIESGFQNHARSYAAAVGMWQFIRSTGRIYGLKGSAWVEERRDPVKSARASARYLRRLYEISGDWYLALVGYNAGPLTIERAVNNVGSRNFWDLARSRWLRNQTKNYVPEILAAILIGKHPQRYGLAVSPEPPFAFETVHVEKATSLAVLAQKAGVVVDELKGLNPELLRGSTPPGGYTLRVPPGFGAPTARALSGLTPAQRLDFHTYLVRKGDSLAKVAARFKVGPEDLLAANDLQPAQFKPGRRIKVPPRPVQPIADQDLRAIDAPKPLPERPLELLPVFPSSTATPKLEAPAAGPKEPGASWPPDPLPAPRKDPAAPVPKFVVAVEGDSLARIARSHGVSLEAIRHANPGHLQQVRPGDRIRLPEEDQPAKPTEYHMVARGETLVSIARQHGLEPADLKSWNRLRSSQLKPGQRLRLRPPATSP